MASSVKLVWASTSNSNWSGRSLCSINPLLIYLERNTTAQLLVIEGNINILKTTQDFSTHVWVMCLNSGHICGLLWE